MKLLNDAELTETVDRAIAEVRRLDAAAFDGPWQCMDLTNEPPPDPQDAMPTERERFSVVAWGTLARNVTEEDGQLIARYRTLAPQLAEALAVAVGALRSFYAVDDFYWRDEPGGISVVHRDCGDRAKNALAHIEALMGGEE